MTDRPATIPPGLRVGLSRHQVIPGQSAKVDEWMTMLNDRADAWAEHGGDPEPRV
jgi:hypothetical protein